MGCSLGRCSPHQGVRGLFEEAGLRQQRLVVRQGALGLLQRHLIGPRIAALMPPWPSNTYAQRAQHAGLTHISLAVEHSEVDQGKPRPSKPCNRTQEALPRRRPAVCWAGIPAASLSAAGGSARLRARPPWTAAAPEPLLSPISRPARSSLCAAGSSPDDTSQAQVSGQMSAWPGVLRLHRSLHSRSMCILYY